VLQACWARLVFAIRWLTVWSLAVVAPLATAAPLQGRISTNGVELEYLDYGGAGAPVIFVPGMASSPHVFDDLAPQLMDHHHVIAYARRGSGDSEMKGPYDVGTLTADLIGLMNGLGIDRAHLIGASAGGNEVTELAAEEPARVASVVLLEGGYDWSDPDFKAAVAALPMGFFEPPRTATRSLEAFRAYQRSLLSEASSTATEAALRESVVIQPDGSVRPRISAELAKQQYAALWSNTPRKYTRVRCPVLAIYAEHLYAPNLGSAARRAKISDYEARYWQPFQAKSIAHVVHEIKDVQIAQFAGAHGDFIFVSEAQVVRSMRQFLARPDAQNNAGAQPLERRSARFQDCVDCPEMVVVPAGTWPIASKPAYDGRRETDAESRLKLTPAHVAILSQPFAVARSPVTRGQYATFARETHFGERGCLIWTGGEWAADEATTWSHPGFSQTDDDPVVCVSEDDAQEYVRWLNAKLGNVHSVSAAASTGRKYDHRAAGCWRGMKADVWEGGHRMPFIARWPGRIAAGGSSAQLVSLTDMLATFAALTGQKLPRNAGEDSLNVLPVLLGQKTRSVRDSMLHEATWPKGMLALRAGNWKLIPWVGDEPLFEGYENATWSPPPVRQPRPGEPPGQLYNLADDPSEQHNVYARHPEIVQQLTELLARERAER